MRSFQLSHSGLSASFDQLFAFGPKLGRPVRQHGRHRARPPEFRVERTAKSAGERRRVMLRGHCRWLLERWPAPVVFVAADPLRAGIVEQALANLFPDRVWAVKPDGVGLLDFDGPAAAAAGDPQQMALDFGKLPLARLEGAGGSPRVAKP